MKKNIGIKKLSKIIFEMNKEKGFWDTERNIGETLMLIVSELGEAMEAHRKGKMCTLEKDDLEHLINISDENFKEMFEEKIKDTFQDEIADTVIRILDMSKGLEVQNNSIPINLMTHIELKLRYNSTRERLHGKNY